jgi:hypothetical protein
MKHIILGLFLFIISPILFCFGQTASKESVQNNIQGDENWDDQFSVYDGLNNSGKSLSVLNGSVYIGGNFTYAGGKNVNYIAKWDELSGWTNLGSDIKNPIEVVRTNLGKLYVGGQSSCFGIWNGNTWDIPSPLTSNTIFSFAFRFADLFIGGNRPDYSVVFWNYMTQRYFPLGNGVAGNAYCMDIIEDSLFVGGDFKKACDIDAKYLAVFNTEKNEWRKFIGEPNNTVRVIKTDSNFMYFGGEFTEIGGIKANHIAKWDRKNNKWYPLGDGLNAAVYSIALDKDDVYVCGTFYNSGANQFSHIARWDNKTNTWYPLGSGLNGNATDIAIINDNVFVTGDFTQAGNKPSYYIARYRLSINSTPVKSIVTYPTNNANSVSVNPILRWRSSGAVLYYHIRISDKYDFSSLIIDKDSIQNPFLEVTKLLAGTTYYWKVCATNSLGTGPWTDIIEFKTIVRPEAPVLISPSNDSTGVSSNLVFTWQPQNISERCELQISTNSIFSNLILDQTNITGTNFSISGLLLNSVYYWRVKSENSAGFSDWSKVFKFTTIANSRQIPLLSLPLNEAVKVPLTPRLIWFALDKALYYHLQVARDRDFINIVFNKGYTSDTYADINNLKGDTKYYWRVEAAFQNQTPLWSEIRYFTTVWVNGIKGENSITEYSLNQNFPNPFNPETSIEFSISENAPVSLKIFDVYGKEVETLINENKSVGKYRVIWKPKNLPSGVYYYRLRAGNYNSIKKMLYIR